MCMDGYALCIVTIYYATCRSYSRSTSGLHVTYSHMYICVRSPNIAAEHICMHCVHGMHMVSNSVHFHVC